MSYRVLIFIISVSLSLPAYPRGVNIDSVGHALSGCWRWDYYGGGIAGLPHTPAWKDVRLEFSRDAQDSLNQTISFRTYADTMLVDSGRTSVWIDPNYLAWLAMDDVLLWAFTGFPMPPFPPIYFTDNKDTLEFTHFSFSDDFYYGFVRDTCMADTTATLPDEVDSVIALLKGCWRYDYYGGGLANLPPTPAGGSGWLRLDRDAQDSLNQTISFWKYNNGVITLSGRTTLSIGGGFSFYDYTFMPDVIYPYNFIYFDLYDDTMVFSHMFPDEFYYGYVKDTCNFTPPPDTTAVIDSIINILNGCWRWDYYYGGRMGLPPTPATANVRLEFTRSALDSMNHTITGESYLNDTLEFSGTCNVVADLNTNGFYTLSCGLFDSIGIVGSPPLYFNFEGDALLFPQEQFLDGFVYGFLSDTCVADTIIPPPDTTAVIDSIINVLDGCWRWDHYFGGFAGLPPTPAWSDVMIEFSQDAQDSMNHTLTGKSYLNDTLEFSGTCNVVADTINIGYYTLSCGLFDSIGIVGSPPLYFNFEGDTLLFPQQSFVDGFVYGFLKNCEDTIINGTEIPEDLQVDIYPNPASDKIIIEVKSSEPVKMSLYDLVGKRLTEHQNLLDITEVDISNIPDGIYFITIETERGLLSRKLVISR